MPIRVHGGVFDQQVLTGSLSHWVICGADFSGAINSFDQAIPNSAAEIIFKNIEEKATINIMNPNDENLSFALEEGRSTWDEISLTMMVQGLGADVGVDHVDCSVCTVKRVPYVWGCGAPGATSFLDLTDTPDTYAGAANYVVTVNPSATGLVFTAVGITSNAFSTITSPSQPTINATGDDTLELIAGSGVLLTTNALSKSITISASLTDDYVPVTAGTALTFSTKYFVTTAGIVTLPSGLGSGEPAGTSITVTKPVGTSIFVNAIFGDTIATDLGNTDSIEIDATQECIFIFNGVSMWHLQIGATN